MKDSGIGVLLIDDEEPLLAVASEWLGRAGGLEVTAVTSADEALRLLSERSFDVVVSDYQMCPMNGIELLKALREQGVLTPFILFTGKGREDVAIEAINNGADFFLQKGGDPKAQFAELLNMIRKSVEKRKVEADLRESKGHFDMIASNVHEVFAIVAPDFSRVYYLSPGFEHIWGLPRDTAVDFESVTSRVHPDDLERLDRERAEIVADGFRTSRSVEFRIIRADSAVRWISSRAFPVLDGEGRMERVIAFAQDVTETVDIESRLKRAADNLNDVLESVSDAVVFIDTNGNLTYFNSAAEKALGIRRQDVLGKRVGDVVSEFRDSPLPHIFEKSQRENAPTRAEFRVPRGRLAGWYDVRLYPSAQGMSIFFRNTTEEKRAEEEHRRIAERYKAIVELTSEGVVVVDLEGRISFVNPRITEMLGYSPEDLLGMRTTDFVGDEAGLILRRELVRRRQGTSGSYPLRLRKRDGTPVDVLVSATPLTSEDGRSVGSFAMLADISEMVGAEAKLRSAKEYSEGLIEGMNLIFLAIDEGTIIREFNGAAARITGYSREEVLGRSVFETIVPETRYPDVRRYFADIWSTDPVEGASHLTHENPIVTRSGEERTILWNNSIFAQPGRRRMVLAFGLDVTRVRQLERERNELAERYRSIVDSAPWGMHFYELEADGTLRFIGANKAADKILGMDNNALAGKPLAEAFPRIANTDLPSKYREVALTGKQWMTEQELHLDGAFDVYSVNVFRIAPATVAVAFQDVTIRRQTEDALRDANSRLKLTGALAVHDVGNLLTVAEGSLVLAAARQTDDVARKHTARASEVLAKIRGQVKYYGDQRLYAGKQVWLNLDAVMERVRSTIDFGPVKVNGDMGGVEVEADPLLEKIIFNILENSIVHGGKVTRIDVGTTEKDGALILFFEDDGNGLTEEERSRIFSLSATGHALHLAHEVLKLYGIEIREVGRIGGGARFEIVVPREAFRGSRSTE